MPAATERGLSSLGAQLPQLTRLRVVFQNKRGHRNKKPTMNAECSQDDRNSFLFFFNQMK